MPARPQTGGGGGSRKKKGTAVVRAAAKPLKKVYRKTKKRN